MDLAALKKEIEGIRRVIGPAAMGSGDDFRRYQLDPAGFMADVLRESMTPGIIQMAEAVRDHEIVVVKSANAVGKTHGAARVAAWFFACHPGAQVYTAAAPPERNLRLLLWGEIGSVARQRPELFRDCEQRTLHIERSPKEFLTGVTIPASGTPAEREAKFSGKHAPYLLFILDEGDAVPDPVYAGIETCMSGGHVRMLIMYNPRAKSGEVYRMVRDERAKVVELSAFDHPNVREGIDVIPGAVRREVVVRRINEYCRHIGGSERPGEDHFILPPYLEGSVAHSRGGKPYPPLVAGMYQIVEPAFAYMVLARYPSRDTAALIAEEWIAEARRRWDERGGLPPKSSEAIMGLDVADMGDDYNVAVFRYGGWVAPPVAWNGVDPIVTGERAAREYHIRKVSRCLVDAIGVGAGVAPHMQRMRCRSQSVRVSESAGYESDLGEFGALRDQLLWMVREWLRVDPSAALPPDEMLLDELRAPTYSVDDGKVRVMKKKIMREILRRSPDRLDALALTFASEGAELPIINTGRPWAMVRKLAGY